MQKKFMREAIRLSLQSIHKYKGQRGPFGALIVKDNEVVGRGINQVFAKSDPTAHAEIVAIRNACKKLNTFQLQDCIIYTSCEPCPMCLGAIYWARIPQVYFAATREDAAYIDFIDAFIYEELNQPYTERKVKFVNLLHDEAVEVFNEWKNLQNKMHY